MLHYILIGTVAAFLSHFINYCIGKPGSDKFSPYEILSAYTVWLSERRLRQVGLYEQYRIQYRENVSRLANQHEVITFNHDYHALLHSAADPFFTWERAVGMCVVCTGFWVSLAVGLVFSWNIVALLTIVVTSHVVIRILSKII